MSQPARSRAGVEMTDIVGPTGGIRPDAIVTTLLVLCCCRSSPLDVDERSHSQGQDLGC